MWSRESEVWGRLGQLDRKMWLLLLLQHQRVPPLQLSRGDLSKELVNPLDAFLAWPRNLHCICVATEVVASPMALIAVHWTSTLFTPGPVWNWILVLETQPLEVFMDGWGSWATAGNLVPVSSRATTTRSGEGSAWAQRWHPDSRMHHLSHTSANPTIISIRVSHNSLPKKCHLVRVAGEWKEIPWRCQWRPRHVHLGRGNCGRGYKTFSIQCPARKVEKSSMKVDKN